MERGEEEGMGRQGIKASLDSGASTVYYWPRTLSLTQKMIANPSSR